MFHVVGEVEMNDLATFIGVFATAGARARGQHGCVGAEVYRLTEDQRRVIVLLTWERQEQFEAFRADPAVKEIMQSGGMQGPPTFTYLQHIATLPT